MSYVYKPMQPGREKAEFEPRSSDLKTLVSMLHIVVIANHFGFGHHLQIFSGNKRNIFSVEAILATNFCILPSVHS